MKSLLAFTTSNICYMADPAGEAPTQPAAPATNEPKTIVGGLTPKCPAYFDSIESASAAVAGFATEYADWNSQASKLIVAGMDSEGAIDPAVYPAGTRVMFHVITNRGTPVLDANGKKAGVSPATVKAMIVWPVPTFEAIFADESAMKWVKDKLDTQIAHVTVAKLRDSDNIAAAAKQMPGVVDTEEGPAYDFASFFTVRESGSALTATYDLLYKELLVAFNAASKLFAKFKLNKAELRKSLESKAYASLIYGPLEDRADKPSMFVMALNAMIREAKAQGKDSTILQTWLETRDNAAATEEPETDEDNFDEAALENLVLVKPADPAPADAPTPEAAPVS